MRFSLAAFALLVAVASAADIPGKGKAAQDWKAGDVSHADRDGNVGNGNAKGHQNWGNNGNANGVGSGIALGHQDWDKAGKASNGGNGNAAGHQNWGNNGNANGVGNGIALGHQGWDKDEKANSGGNGNAAAHQNWGNNGNANGVGNGIALGHQDWEKSDKASHQNWGNNGNANGVGNGIALGHQGWDKSDKANGGGNGNANGHTNWGNNGNANGVGNGIALGHQKGDNGAQAGTGRPAPITSASSTAAATAKIASETPAPKTVAAATSPAPTTPLAPVPTTPQTITDRRSTPAVGQHEKDTGKHGHSKDNEKLNQNTGRPAPSLPATSASAATTKADSETPAPKTTAATTTRPAPSTSQAPVPTTPKAIIVQRSTPAVGQHGKDTGKHGSGEKLGQGNGRGDQHGKNSGKDDSGEKKGHGNGHSKDNWKVNQNSGRPTLNPPAVSSASTVTPKVDIQTTAQKTVEAAVTTSPAQPEAPVSTTLKAIHHQPTTPAAAAAGCGSCKADGNIYRTVTGTGCRVFTEEAPEIAPRAFQCADGLVFDSSLCVCNYDFAFTCPSECGSANPQPSIDTGRPALNPPAVSSSPTVTPKVDIQTTAHKTVEAEVSTSPATPKAPVSTTPMAIHHQPTTPAATAAGCGSCKANGNVYRTIAGTGCRIFTEEAPGIAPRAIQCADGLVFDSNLCVCNYDFAFTCPSLCGSKNPKSTIGTDVVTGRPAPVITSAATSSGDTFKLSFAGSCGVCQRGSNVYRTSARDGCRTFTEEADGIEARMFECPAGLVFDTKQCLCEYDHLASCQAKCDGSDSSPPATPSVKAPTAAPAVVVNDVTIKTTGSCGVCQSGNNIYRTSARDGCRTFTEEADGIAARTFECPEGLVFDAKQCRCEYDYLASCQTKCGGSDSFPPATPTVKAPTAAPAIVVNDVTVKITSSCGVCTAAGNVYRTSASDGCATFTEEADGIPARTLHCPAGLVFDAEQCRCEFAHLATCQMKCGGSDARPPATPTIHAPTAAPVVVVNDVTTKPAAGCGVCRIGCSTFRVLEEGGNCNAFSVQETADAAPVRRTCPAGLSFDASLCTCSWGRLAAACGCAARPTPDSSKINHVSSCGTCKASGSTYRTVPGTGCSGFTQEAAGLTATRFNCPAGLVFDPSICQCNWDWAVTCKC